MVTVCLTSLTNASISSIRLQWQIVAQIILNHRLQGTYLQSHNNIIACLISFSTSHISDSQRWQGVAREWLPPYKKHRDKDMNLETILSIPTDSFGRLYAHSARKQLLFMLKSQCIGTLPILLLYLCFFAASLTVVNRSLLNIQDIEGRQSTLYCTKVRNWMTYWSLDKKYYDK